MIYFGVEKMPGGTSVSARGVVRCGLGGRRTPLLERGDALAQRAEAARLAEAAVHAGVEVGGLLGRAAVCGEGDDGEFARAEFEVLADAPRRGEPVHVGHLDVHEHEVVLRRRRRVALRARLDGGEGLAPVVGDRHAVPELLEHDRREPLVDAVVLGDEHAQRRRRSGRVFFWRRGRGTILGVASKRRVARRRVAGRSGAALKRGRKPGLLR
mmetsp:Transcript_20413/g.81636  ORF Transcript_20413/g.81636 Transcript_20413/m.81636 type:complete len:212 (-) Transcript_20413:1852-2487(-)